MKELRRYIAEMKKIGFRDVELDRAPRHPMLHGTNKNGVRVKLAVPLTPAQKERTFMNLRTRMRRHYKREK